MCMCVCVCVCVCVHICKHVYVCSCLVHVISQKAVVHSNTNSIQYFINIKENNNDCSFHDKPIIDGTQITHNTETILAI